MKKSVDILLPYWGDVELFKKAVESVLSQTNPGWKLFIFDDSYPSDEPAAYVSKLNDKRISYYRHSKNLGITKNFNYALSQATSEYCVMFGCDDIMLPNYVERSLSEIGECDFYQPGVEVIDINSEVYFPVVDRLKRLLRPKQGIHTGEQLAKSLARGNWLYFPSILWRTQSLQRYRFDEKYSVVEDVMVEMQMIMDGSLLKLDDAITFQYRRSSESVSSKEKQKNGVRFKEESEAYDKLSSDFSKLGWKKASLTAKLRIISRLHQLVS